ncbi:UNVERIFIED_ORG: hypothetical protein ABIB52_001872 [Arthrobacter sp. UYCu721]
MQQQCLVLADTPGLGLRPVHPSVIVLELQAGKFQPSDTHLITLTDSTFALGGIDGGTAMTHFTVNSSIERFPAFRLSQSIRCCC